MGHRLGICVPQGRASAAADLVDKLWWGSLVISRGRSDAFSREPRRHFIRFE